MCSWSSYLWPPFGLAAVGGFDAGGAAGRVSDKPGASSSGSFFFTRLPGQLGLIVGGAILMMSWEGTGTVGLAMVIVLFLVRYRLFRGLSSGSHSCASGCYHGVDNLGVVRHVGRLLDGNVGSRPALGW